MRRAMASAGLLTLLLAARPLSAKEILIPNVVAFARGSYSSLWGTEIRIINPTSSPKSFRVVDWIGSPRQRPYQVTVLPGETVVRGGFRRCSRCSWGRSAVRLGARATKVCSFPPEC